MTGSSLLIVDDDAAISKLLAAYLRKEGFDIAIAESVREMQERFAAQPPEMILLDVMLPDADGWSALRWLRARSAVPVIMLTGKGETIDKIVGLEMGADDYLAKPFDLRELLARIRTIQRRLDRPGAPTREGAAEKQEVRFQGWVLDLAAHQLLDTDGQSVHLTQAEYRILVLLTAAPRQPVHRDQLMEAVAGRNWDPMDRSVDVHVSNLRRKLDREGGGPSLIRTVRGAGYMFVPGAESGSD